LGGRRRAVATSDLDQEVLRHTSSPEYAHRRSTDVHEVETPALEAGPIVPTGVLEDDR
jgi:hypothetical protein